MAAQVKRC